jgi:hypothetical protein
MGDRKTRPDGFCFLASRKREDPLVSRLVLKLSSLLLPDLFILPQRLGENLNFTATTFIPVAKGLAICGPSVQS